MGCGCSYSDDAAAAAAAAGATDVKLGSHHSRLRLACLRTATTNIKYVGLRHFHYLRGGSSISTLGDGTVGQRYTKGGGRSPNNFDSHIVKYAVFGIKPTYNQWIFFISNVQFYSKKFIWGNGCRGQTSNSGAWFLSPPMNRPCASCGTLRYVSPRFPTIYFLRSVCSMEHSIICVVLRKLFSCNLVPRFAPNPGDATYVHTHGLNSTGPFFS